MDGGLLTVLANVPVVIDSTRLLTTEHLSPERADDAHLVRALSRIVNAAYAVGEAGMWAPGAARVADHELQELVAAAEVVGAWRGSRVVGCVRVHPVGEKTWSFGMLATDPEAQGAGIGRSLVLEAEAVTRAAGARVIQLEMLVPTEHPLESKVALAQWYSRLGYRKVDVRQLQDDYPGLVDKLVLRCEYQIWQKPLGG